MNERSWGILVWLGILGAIGSVLAILAVYSTLKDTTYELVLFIVAVLFAMMSAVANVGATRARRIRFDGEMAFQQQRVDDLFSATQTVSSAKSIAPQAQVMSDEAAMGDQPLVAGSNADSLGFDTQPAGGEPAGVSQAVNQEAAAEGESAGEEVGEHERAEHGGWE